MRRITAYIPRSSSNLDHPCFQNLLNAMEIERLVEEWANLEDEDFVESSEEIAQFLRTNDLEILENESYTIQISDWNNVVLTRKPEGSDLGVEPEAGTSAIYDYIDERIGTEVIVLDEDGNESTIPYEKVHPEHLLQHRYAKKTCNCGKPTKIKFNNGYYGLSCLESIQISHEAHLWNLHAGGVQFNWDDGATTYVSWGDLNHLGIMRGLLGANIKRMCMCSHQILDPTVWIF